MLSKESTALLLFCSLSLRLAASLGAPWGPRHKAPLLSNSLGSSRGSMSLLQLLPWEGDR